MRLFRDSKRRAAPGLMFAATLASPFSALAEVEIEREKRQQRSSFVAVVGHWTPVDDNGPAFKVDGTAWSGQTPKADLETVGKTLFTRVSEPFVANGTAPGAFPLAVWTGASDVTSGTLRVQFKLVSGESDQTAGIVFGLQPGGEYFFLRYNTKDGNVAIWGYSGGERRRIADGATKAQLPLNTWHELVVTIAGTKVSGSVRGQPLTIEHTFDATVSGRVGLWTKRDAVTVFKDFRLARS